MPEHFALDILACEFFDPDFLAWDLVLTFLDLNDLACYFVSPAVLAWNFHVLMFYLGQFCYFLTPDTLAQDFAVLIF